MTLDATNRRDGLRLDIRIRIQGRVLDGHNPNATFTGEISDCSLSGMRFETTTSFCTTQELELVLFADDEELTKIGAIVSWCQPRQSPAGKSLFDVGVHVQDGWLDRQSHPLMRALHKLFVA